MLVAAETHLNTLVTSRHSHNLETLPTFKCRPHPLQIQWLQLRSRIFSFPGGGQPNSWIHFLKQSFIGTQPCTYLFINGWWPLLRCHGRFEYFQQNVWPAGVKYLLSGPSWPFMDKSSETGFRQWNIDKLLHDSSENLIRLVYHCPATFEGQAFHMLWIRACLNA